MIDPKLLEILVCPISRCALVYKSESNELISPKAGLAYPIKADIPVLLVDEARHLTQEELDKFKV